LLYTITHSKEEMYIYRVLRSPPPTQKKKKKKKTLLPPFWLSCCQTITVSLHEIKGRKTSTRYCKTDSTLCCGIVYLQYLYQTLLRGSLLLGWGILSIGDNTWGIVIPIETMISESQKEKMSVKQKRESIMQIITKKTSKVNHVLKHAGSRKFQSTRVNKIS